MINDVNEILISFTFFGSIIFSVDGNKKSINVVRRKWIKLLSTLFFQKKDEHIRNPLYNLITTKK